MTVEAWRLASLGLSLVLLLALGAAGGCWLTDRHYRPLLETANTDLAKAKGKKPKAPLKVVQLQAN